MKLIYWSSTGNTEEMANLIGKGIREEGKEAELINISNDEIPSIEEEKILILGCPACGEEELDDTEFLPFFESIEGDLKGKKVLLFGSYGWGDGEWIRNWKEKVESLGAAIPLEPVMVNYAPDGDTETECINYGKEIAKL